MSVKQLSHLEQFSKAEPVLSGYLQKKSPAGLGFWQKRYFEIRDSKLKWFQTEAQVGQAPKGVIDFRQFQCAVTQDKDQRYFTLSIRG